MQTHSLRAGRGFTLIELLVVISIIALLIGLLVPALSQAVGRARAARSMSSLRQWGVGFAGFSGEHNDSFPWEGMPQAGDMAMNMTQELWWANALPPYVGQRMYRQIVLDADGDPEKIPFPPISNIFVDPMAQPPADAPWSFSWQGNRHFYFNYVLNSRLNDTRNPGGPGSPKDLMPLSVVKRFDATILMVEMRASDEELPSNDPHDGRSLNRHHADWKRFAARHDGGGHLLFTDAHVAWMSNVEATTNSDGKREGAAGDWNTNRLIWDPLGPAKD